MAGSVPITEGDFDLFVLHGLLFVFPFLLKKKCWSEKGVRGKIRY